jgi:hypothetical protein
MLNNAQTGLIVLSVFAVPLILVTVLCIWGYLAETRKPKDVKENPVKPLSFYYGQSVNVYINGDFFGWAKVIKRYSETYGCIELGYRSCTKYTVKFDGGETMEVSPYELKAAPFFPSAYDQAVTTSSAHTVSLTLNAKPPKDNAYLVPVTKKQQKKAKKKGYFGNYGTPETRG